MLPFNAFLYFLQASLHRILFKSITLVNFLLVIYRGTGGIALTTHVNSFTVLSFRKKTFEVIFEVSMIGALCLA